MSEQMIVRSPHTGAIVTEMAVTGPEGCERAVTDAVNAFPSWSRTPAVDRSAALNNAANAVNQAIDELAELNHRETGKPHGEARGGAEVAAATLRQYAELGPLHSGRSLNGAWSATDFMVAEPRGTVAVLTPWNDPLAVAAGLIGAALATGNTVVHKPSERCPGTGRRFAELIAGALPTGVLQIVDGEAALGARLARDERIELVAHVGSSAAGGAIARACAERGAKALLENGGNDALIVDAAIESRWAAGHAALGAFANSGQICVSVERIYLVADDGAAEAFLSALVNEAGRWVNRIGPMVDERQREQVHRHVIDAVKQGARILAGGELPTGPGSFYPPTVLADCTPDMLLFREETFGPVAPVRVVADFDTALREAADDRYGLGATVLTSDMAHAQLAWRTLPVGTVKINEVFGGAPGGAAQPRRASGAGFGYGPELLDEMTTTKVVHIAAPGG